MKGWLRGAGVGFLVGGAVVLFTGCVGVAYPAGPPGVYYDYDYYPAWNIYFYPAGRLYYWNEGGHWRSGRALPRGYHFQEGPHERLRLPTRQPWIEHHEEHGGNRLQHGAPARKRNRH